MASQLSPECWMHIFHYLDNLNTLENCADLHSCLLVNRFWCKMIVQILWKDPFSYQLPSKKFNLLLKTYLKCLSEQSIKRIEEEKIKLKIFNEKPMFRYSEFLRGLVIDTIRFDDCMSIHDLINFEGTSYGITQEKFSKIDIILKELIMLLCDNSNRIRSLSITPCNMIDYIIPLLNEDKINFQRIKSFTFTSPTLIHEYHKFIMALSRVSRDITHVRINANVYQETLAVSLEILLNSQNNLCSLDLEYPFEQRVSYYEPILLKLSNPKIISSLSSLSFKNINFIEISKRSMNSLTEVSRNLRTFKVERCLNCSLLCDVMKSCENLVEFTYDVYRFDKDLEFLLTILKSSSKSLKYLDLFWIRDDNSLLLEKHKLIKGISEYCTQLISLKLRRLQCEDLLIIWCNCKQLEEHSFLCCEQSNWDEDQLEDLGKILPCTLKVLKIRNWDDVPFSAVALERFLKGCKESLKKLEIYSFKKLSARSEYMNVLRNSGVYY